MNEYFSFVDEKKNINDKKKLKMTDRAVVFVTYKIIKMYIKNIPKKISIKIHLMGIYIQKYDVIFEIRKLG